MIDYTVIALETTGFSPPVSHVIELAAIKIRAGLEVSRYESLVKPPKNHRAIEECLATEKIFRRLKNF